MKHITIALQPAEAYYLSYGILLESTTHHMFSGLGVHNPSFDHRLQVWQNRPANDGSGRLRDPHGRTTDQAYSYLWTAVPSVIATQTEVPRSRGVSLEIGDVVDLQIHGYVIGTFQVRSRTAYDPHLVLVDTASSASRQHYIETGCYLTPDELKEF